MSLLPNHVKASIRLTDIDVGFLELVENIRSRIVNNKKGSINYAPCPEPTGKFFIDIV